MSDQHVTRGVHVSSGEGIVAHLSNLTAFASGEETRLNELLVRLNALKDAPWHEVVRTLTAGIAESNYDTHPDLACVSIGEDRVAALVFGDASLTITTDRNETTLHGRDSSTWIDVAIHGAVDRVQAGTQSDSVIVGVLRDGVVPAGGFLLDTSGPMPSSTRWAEGLSTSELGAAAPSATSPPVPDVEPASVDTQSTIQENQRSLAGIFARLDKRYQPEETKGPESPRVPDLPDVPERLSADAAAVTPDREAEDDPTDDPTNELPPPLGDIRSNGSAPEPAGTPVATESPMSSHSGPATLATPRPQLRGVLCPDGHLTNSNDVTCRTCGREISPDAEIVIADRPTLGQITFDDGAVLSIDRPAAVGSDVPAGYEIDGEPATIVRLDDGLGGVSAIQVEIHTSGWDVEVHDMNSKNGTYTVLQGERQTRTRLRAGQSVVLQDGMMVEVGGRNFTYSLGSSAD